MWIYFLTQILENLFNGTSNPNAEEAKARNKINILFEEDFVLSDEELEMLESWDSLESLYTNSYKKSDFEKQVKGLQRFDKDNKLNIFDSPAFQSILESAKAEVEEKIIGAEEEEQDADEKEETKSVSKTTSSKKSIAKKQKNLLKKRIQFQKFLKKWTRKL